MYKQTPSFSSELGFEQQVSFPPEHLLKQGLRYSDDIGELKRLISRN